MIAQRGKHDTLNQCCFNPLSPRDAFKHHFTFLNTDLGLIFLKNENFHGTGLPIHGDFFYF